MLSKIFVLASLAVSTTFAATAPIYGQCGGQGWTGATTCASGSICVVSNAYYSQCLPGAGATKATTTVKPASTKAASSTSPAKTTIASGSGQTFKISITEYGSGDTFGSGNCNTATTGMLLSYNSYIH
jgi:hypothetical protein